MDEKKEEWLPIPGYEGYQASNQGRIKGKYGKILKPAVEERGYRRVNPYTNGKNRSTSVHKLVMLAFVGPRPEGKQICHYDGNPANNRLENLDYVTAAENERQKKEHGTSLDGERHHHAKLTTDQVDFIRTMCNPKDYRLGMKTMCRIFNVSLRTIQGIVGGDKWKEHETVDWKSRAEVAEAKLAEIGLLVKRYGKHKPGMGPVIGEIAKAVERAFEHLAGLWRTEGARCDELEAKLAEMEKEYIALNEDRLTQCHEWRAKLTQVTAERDRASANLLECCEDLKQECDTNIDLRAQAQRLRTALEEIKHEAPEGMEMCDNCSKIWNIARQSLKPTDTAKPFHLTWNCVKDKMGYGEKCECSNCRNKPTDTEEG
jgi:hypothetical protein